MPASRFWREARGVAQIRLRGDLLNQFRADRIRHGFGLLRWDAGAFQLAGVAQRSERFRQFTCRVSFG